MAVKIRLKQTGSRNRRTFRIVAVDESKKRDGKVIEELGSVNPLIKPTGVQINEDRLAYWQSQGALCTASVTKILTVK